MLRILKSDSAADPVFASYRAELASGILRASERGVNLLLHRNRHKGATSSGTWVGRHRKIIWKDVNAAGTNRMMV
jgi:hypothetical protein